MTGRDPHGDPCPHVYCATHVQGTIDEPADRTAGLLLHLQTVHYPDASLDDLAARLYELTTTHRIRWGGEAY